MSDVQAAKRSGRKYTAHRRASIMNAELIVDVHCRQQFRDMVQWLIDEEYKFQFERLGTGDSVTPETYRLTIENICWAANITKIGEELERHDYDDEGAIEVRNGRGGELAA